MGGQSSTIIKNVCKTNMLYKQDLEAISKTMNNINTKVETALKQAAANKVSLDNQMDLSGTSLVVSGKGTVADIGQSNKAKVLLSVEQVAEIMNSITEEITNEIKDTVFTSVDMATLSNLIGNVTQEVKNSATSIASAGRSDKNQINNTIETDIDVINKQRIENYIENVVSTCLSNHSDKYCGTDFNATNKFKLVNGQIVVNDGANLNLTQNNDVEITTECSQIDKINNTIIVALCGGVGIQIDNKITMTTTNETKTDTDQKVDNQGVGKDLGDTIESVGTSIGSIFSSATTIFVVLGCVICCVVLIAIGSLAFIMTDETGSQTIRGLSETAIKMTPTGKIASAVKGGNGSLFDAIMARI